MTMSHITITIKTDGGAFRREGGALETAEVRDVLDKIADKITANYSDEGWTGRVLDTWGVHAADVEVHEDGTDE